jgi:hypothetical protein
VKYTDHLNQLFKVANVYNLTFYSLAATCSPGVGSFCKEFSNNASWLNVTKTQWKDKETFKVYNHGRAMQAIVEELSDPNKQPPKKIKEADGVQKQLCIELNILLGKSCSLILIIGSSKHLAKINSS